MENKKSKLWQLFSTTFLISASTSGGYAIVGLMKDKFVKKKQWLNEDEMIDLLAIAQSSPGPIAINTSILVGYRVCGIIGAIVTMLGTTLPPLIIMSIVAGFYEQFKDKTDLIRSCGLHMQEQLPPYVEIKKGEVVPYLHDLLDNHVRCMFGDRARFMLNLQVEYPDLYKELCTPLLEKTKNHLISALEEGVSNGYVRPGFNTELLFSYLMKHVYLVASDNDHMGNHHALDDIFNHSLMLILRGILTEKGVKALDALIEVKK